ILHGLGQPGLHLRHLAAGSLIKLLGIYYLIPFRGLGITGATLGLTLGYAVSSFLNYRAISRKLTTRPDFLLVFARPLLATICLSWGDPRCYQLLVTNLPVFNEELLIALHLLILIFLYLVIMLVIGGFRAGDLEKIRH
ncbi:MAG: polysaccharide biosynthesis C-terminal domain-containing protein, partial [Bacillota bacterium]